MLLKRVSYNKIKYNSLLLVYYNKNVHGGPSTFEEEVCKHMFYLVASYSMFWKTVYFRLTNICQI